jgi:hypothetical protein
MEHEFADLVFVARYVDSMIAQTGNQDWGVVYEYGDDDLDDGACPPPRAVLLRQGGQWLRRAVSASLVNDEWVMEFQDGSESNVRTFDIVKTASGWKLTMYQNSQEVGGGVGGPDDYDFLLEQAMQFSGE